MMCLMIRAVVSRSMSCGRTPSPPKRAIVSAIRLPVTAFMLAETTGCEPPGKSTGVRSTSIREVPSK